MLYSLRGIIYY